VENNLRETDPDLVWLVNTRSKASVGGQSEMKGYTLIWSGTVEDSFQAWKPWSDFKGKIATKSVESAVCIYVANECINWEHYRECDEYVPVFTNVKR
jgi:hypothetical protein